MSCDTGFRWGRYKHFRSVKCCYLYSSGCVNWQLTNQIRCAYFSYQPCATNTWILLLVSRCEILEGHRCLSSNGCWGGEEVFGEISLLEPRRWRAVVPSQCRPCMNNSTTSPPGISLFALSNIASTRPGDKKQYMVYLYVCSTIVHCSRFSVCVCVCERERRERERE